MTIALVALGLGAGIWSFMLIAEPSRQLVIKLGTLLDMAERADPALYRERVAPLSPFVDGKFKHKRLTGVLRADMTPFGELCQRLQREAKKLDRRAHVGMLPFGLYVLAAALWLVF